MPPAILNKAHSNSSENQAMNPLRKLTQSGQSIWLDNLSRTLLREGGLQNLIDNDGISGVTSNPSIFQKALAESPYYHDDLSRLKSSEADAEKRYEALVIPDIQAACDLLFPTFQRTQGNDGYVSLEVSPHRSEPSQPADQDTRHSSGSGRV
jgi:transaldolase